MPKNPHPYSAQIVAKTIKDWQHVDFNLIRESCWPTEIWNTLQVDAPNPNYNLRYRNWSEGYLCHPEGLGEDVHFDDKHKLGEKLIKPYLAWKEANEEKRRKAEERKEKRERLKKLKEFLA